MLTISELAKSSGISLGVVRYYVRIGLIEPSQRMDNGYRLFNSHDVQMLKFIQAAKHLGFTLSEIGQIKKQAAQGKSPCAGVRSAIRDRIADNLAKLDAMLALQDRMEQALEIWDNLPDLQPEVGRVCHLIETVGIPSANEGATLYCQQERNSSNYKH